MRGLIWPGWVTGAMWPRPSISSTRTRGSTPARSRATARAAAVEAVPVRSSVGTSSVRQVSSGVGSLKAECHSGFMARTAPASVARRDSGIAAQRSEEHTSELQSLRHLVCRLLLEKNKQTEAQTCASGYGAEAQHRA